ncbi:expansin family protein [Pseudohyphozyma bogoriensis]|nr:expansin family protein [Pseudohyphozyma bogoriensis]
MSPSLFQYFADESVGVFYMTWTVEKDHHYLSMGRPNNHHYYVEAYHDHDGLDESNHDEPVGLANYDLESNHDATDDNLGLVLVLVLELRLVLVSLLRLLFQSSQVSHSPRLFVFPSDSAITSGSLSLNATESLVGATGINGTLLAGATSGISSVTTTLTNGTVATVTMSNNGTAVATASSTAASAPAATQSPSVEVGKNLDTLNQLVIGMGMLVGGAAHAASS